MFVKVMIGKLARTLILHVFSDIMKLEYDPDRRDYPADLYRHAYIVIFSINRQGLWEEKHGYKKRFRKETATEVA